MMEHDQDNNDLTVKELMKNQKNKKSNFFTKLKVWQKISIVIIPIFLIFCTIYYFNFRNSSSENNINDAVSKTDEEIINDKIQSYANELNNYKNYKEGIYQVGKDFPEGEYCLFSNRLDNVNNSYTVRKSEFDDGSNSIAFENLFLNTYITLKKGEFIEFEAATLFSSSSMPTVHTNYPYATMKIGKDIEEGNYIIKPLPENEWVGGNSVYFEVTEPIGDYERNEIVTNGLDFKNEKKVKLKKGQYFEVKNCTFEKQ